MKKKAIINRIVRIAETNGWSVNYSSRYSEPGNLDFDFSKFTKFGQDFTVSGILKGNDPSTLIKDLREGYEAFDPDEEAMLWIGPDGHGKNGAPYRIADIVKDMEDAEDMYGDLVVALENEF